MIGIRLCTHWHCYIGLLIALLLPGCAGKRLPEAAPTAAHISHSSIVKHLGDEIYEAHGEAAIVNMSPEAAKELAVQDAAAKILAFAVGAHMQATELSVQGASQSQRGGQKQAIGLSAFMSLTRQRSEGAIAKREVVEAVVEQRSGLLASRVLLRAKVVRHTGAPDPSFQLTAKLNREMFQPGDSLQVEVAANQACSIYIFGIGADLVIAQLFPNPHAISNTLAAGQRLRFPDDTGHGGLALRVSLPAKADQSSELIKVLCSKQPLLFSRFTAREASSPGLEALLQDLLTVPRSEIQEIDLPYVVARGAR